MEINIICCVSFLFKNSSFRETHFKFHNFYVGSFPIVDITWIRIVLSGAVWARTCQQNTQGRLTVSPTSFRKLSTVLLEIGNTFSPSIWSPLPSDLAFAIMIPLVSLFLWADAIDFLPFYLIDLHTSFQNSKPLLSVFCWAISTHWIIVVSFVI